MGAVRMRVQTADKNIPITQVIHSTPSLRCFVASGPNMSPLSIILLSQVKKSSHKIQERNIYKY